MYTYPSLFFDFNIKYDILKKSNEHNLNSLVYLNKKKISLTTPEKKNIKRDVKLKMFWSLEILTLQKAFFTYKLTKARKSFYSLKGSTSNITKKRGLFFLYSFMKTSLCSIPYLNYFFIATSLRNLKIEGVSVFDFIKQNYKLFYNLIDFYLTYKTKNTILTSIWLSSYKIIL
jgi:hypothetical protein